MAEIDGAGSALAAVRPDVESADDAAATAAFIRVTQVIEEQPKSVTASICRHVGTCIALPFMPIRVIFILLSVFVIWVIYRMSICLGACSGSKGKPEESRLGSHSQMQKCLLWLTSPFYRFILFCFGITYIRTRRVRDASGAIAAASGPVTVVANHVSMLDGPLISIAVRGQITGVAARWVTKMPFAATIARAHRVLDVSRGPKDASAAVAPEPESSTDGEGAGKPPSATAQIAEYQRRCKAGSGLVPLLVFPEATTKSANCLVKFRTGVFVAGEPVQPVVLLYPDHFGWAQSLGGHVRLMLTRCFGCVDMVWLPVYWPNEAERTNPQLFADNVQAAMAEAMKLPPDRVSTTVGFKEITEFLRREAA
eukprot:TRINITY_DN23541_c0_g1_i1.p1 TRINITY_DN23541_c0_g1~~TRINITY_DN23541_c0_g1_i1.p1  ORF type:complete len:367 (+),score=36.75 TRINITY_DN23541_c0_g1_i1:152-1252(+)